MIDLNAKLCWHILDYFKWSWGSNWFATWLANQIPYDSW